jgi:hypothetical protein
MGNRLVSLVALLALGCEMDPGATYAEPQTDSGGQAATVASCGGETATGGTSAAEATGGAVSFGGQSAAATGGAAPSTGRSATGGIATGGAAPTGGRSATGGSATGGLVSTGGAATGGSVATGGAVATGGNAATGGSFATGGAPAADCSYAPDPCERYNDPSNPSQCLARLNRTKYPDSAFRTWTNCPKYGAAVCSATSKQSDLDCFSICVICIKYGQDAVSTKACVDAQNGASCKMSG